MRTITTLLIIAVGALVALSLTMLASATMLDGGAAAGLRTQALAAALGFAALIALGSSDYHRLHRLAPWIYAATVVLLILVLTPLGKETKGAQRWLFKTQPSEFAKFGLIVSLAVYCARNAARMDRFVPGILGGAGLTIPIIALILKEPDRGTAALLMLVTLLVLLVAGVRWWFVVPPALLGGAALVAMVALSPMARNRIDAFLHPENHRDGAAHQVRKGLYAFGEGGWEGRGLGRGSLKYTVPEVHTDFILPAIGEEMGLTCTLGIVAAYGVLLFAGLTVASRAPDDLGRLLATGVTFLIAAQACINLGVVTGVIPNKGMPLPFVSRGGSSIAVLLALVGLLISVAREAVPGSASAPSSGAGTKRGRGRRDPFAPDSEVLGAT
jgi:cell division protein FtsW